MVVKGIGRKAALLRLHHFLAEGLQRVWYLLSLIQPTLQAMCHFLLLQAPTRVSQELIQPIFKYL